MSPFKKKKSNIPRRRLAEDEKQISASSNTFKRNRTLTGTTSINPNNIDTESSRVHIHYLATHRRRIINIMIIVALSAILLWILIGNITATVSVNLSNVTISKPVNLTLYENTIDNYLDTNILGRLKFLLNESALSAYISNKLPEVSSIKQQDTIGLGKTSFSITLRVPVATWKIKDKQYFVDSNGVPFEKNYFSSSLVNVVDNSGASPQTGVAIISNRFLGFVGRVVSTAKANGYTVTQAILPIDTTRELDVYLKGINTLVKLSVDRPAGEQIQDMDRAIKYFSSHNLAPGYIDVRVSGRAFYK